MQQRVITHRGEEERERDVNELGKKEKERKEYTNNHNSGAALKRTKQNIFCHFSKDNHNVHCQAEKWGSFKVLSRVFFGDHFKIKKYKILYFNLQVNPRRFLLSNVAVFGWLGFCFFYLVRIWAIWKWAIREYSGEFKYLLNVRRKKSELPFHCKLDFYLLKFFYFISISW